MKKARWNRWAALLTAFVMAVLLLPAPEARAADVYGKTTDTGVRVRKQASTDADYWFRVDIGTVMQVLDTVKKGNVTWYKVSTTNPDSGGARTYVGYVHGDYFTLISGSEAGTAAAAAPAAAASGLATSTSSATGMIANSGVNFRAISGGDNIMTHASMMKLDRGTVVELISVPSVIDSDHWYRVRYSGREGYIQAPFIKVISSGTAAASAAPAASASTASESVYGYVKTTKSGVNLRIKPAQDMIQQIGKGLVLPMMAGKTSASGYTWYYVKVGSVYGYVRGDCVVECDANGNTTGSAASSAPAPAAADTAGASYGYIKLTKDKVNLRKSPAGASLEQLAAGTVLPMTGTAVSSGKYVWYPVKASSGKRGYIRSDCAALTATGNANAATAAAEAEAAASEASASTYGYIRTTVSSVNLRQKPAGSKVGSVPKNQVLPVRGPTQNVSGYVWYPVTYQGTSGFIRSDCAVVTDASGVATSAVIASTSDKYVKTTLDKVNLRASASKDSTSKYVVAKGTVLPYDKTTSVGGSRWYHVSYRGDSVWVLGSCVSTASAAEYQTWANANTGSTATASANSGGYRPATAGQEATYNVLKVGSSGSAVSKLVQELINQGYYKGTVTSSYTTAVETAVKAFQTAKGLTADGLAGPQTQHALFQTVPVGTANASDLAMAIYPAEKIDWYKGGINELWARGASYKVYDVKTGIVWWARRWAGGYHVDAEPLTAADTARLCVIYGVKTADQIKTKNLWQRRPCLVTIGNRTFACSLYGVPHNYPAGDTIADNNFKGQMCIHFTNSKTHDSHKVDTYHKQAIEYAWLNAPNGHK